MINKLLLADVKKLPFYRIKKALKKKNEIYEFKDIDFDNIEDNHFDYFYYEYDNRIVNERLLKYEKKFKKVINFISVEKLGITVAENLKEEEVLELAQKSEYSDMAKDIYQNDRFLGLFYFNLLDDNRVDYNIVNKFLAREKSLTYKMDKIETFFNTKHLLDLLIMLIRDNNIVKNDLLSLNNYINLSYNKNYKISEIADFCSSKVEFLEENVKNENFYGCGHKLQKIFNVNSYFDLASGILYNQR